MRYIWFYDHFCGSQPEIEEQIEQYTREFLICLLGTTMFMSRWNIVGQYLLSALVVLPLNGSMVGSYWRAWEVYAYFPALAPISRDEMAATVPYSRLYDGKCYPCRRNITTFVYYSCFFDTMTARKPWVVMLAGTRDEYTSSRDTSRLRILLEGPFCWTWYLGERFVRQTLGLPYPIVLAPPPLFIRTVNSLLVDAIVQFMAGDDANLYCGVGDYTAFIRTHLMLPLIGARAGGAADVLVTKDAVHIARPDV
ncbi:hypothetical protein CsSME_00035751 [Camellia sinensis var. sinensis]